MPGPSTRSESDIALHFFGLSAASVCLSGGISYLLISATDPPEQTEQLALPTAFWASSLLLLAGSGTLHRALCDVRLERQRSFRQLLLISVGIGTLFVGVQIYGLWFMVHSQNPANAQTDANAFALVFAACHGIHFVVAMLFVSFITCSALAGRYDHEYYWGVTVCTYFWHVLGIAWIFILAVFAIVD